MSVLENPNSVELSVKSLVFFKEKDIFPSRVGVLTLELVLFEIACDAFLGCLALRTTAMLGKSKLLMVAVKGFDVNPEIVCNLLVGLLATMCDIVDLPTFLALLLGQRVPRVLRMSLTAHYCRPFWFVLTKNKG